MINQKKNLKKNPLINLLMNIMNVLKKDFLSQKKYLDD